jgi:CRP-like cAMP-binding protein
MASITVIKGVKRKIFPFNPEQPLRIRWDLLIMLLATVNCFQVPYTIAFTDPDSVNLTSDVIDALINLFFLLDIFINFMTTYYEEDTKEEIFEYRSIAIHYMKGRLWMDLLSSIPFDYIAYFYSSSNTIWFELLSLFKLIRILRLSRLITYLNLRNEVKSSLRFIKLFFFLMLFLHWLGCLWFYIAKQSKEWMPPLDYVFVGTNIYNEGSFMQYWSALYHAVLMLGMNDIGPREEYEYLFIVLTLWIWAIVNAIIFGNFAVVLQSLNRKSSKFQEKLENVTDIMKNLGLQDDVKSNIKYYIEYTNNTQENQKEMDKFLSILSPSLRKSVTNCIFKDTIMMNEIFKGQDQVLSTLCENLFIKLFLPEDKIISQGDEPDYMYFISSGRVDVFVTDEFDSQNFTNSLKIGDYFGELALLKKCKRTASVLSRDYSTWATLSLKNFENLLIRYPNIQKLMEKHIRLTYNDKWRRFMHRSLRNINYLGSGISSRIIDEISYRFEMISVNKGDYLFQAGTPWDSIYIIKQGEIDVYLQSSVMETYFDTIYAGCSIGSYGWTKNETYYTSGKGKTDCIVLKLNYEELLKIREKFEQLDDIMTQYEEYIEKSGPPFCDYNLYRHKTKNISPQQKLMYGIRRLWRIIKSQKTYAIRELIFQAKENAKLRSSIMQDRRNTRVLHRNPITTEQRNEQTLLLLNIKIDSLTKTLTEQAEMIEYLKNDLGIKINKLLELQGINPESVVQSAIKPPISKTKKNSKKVTKCNMDEKIVQPSSSFRRK